MMNREHNIQEFKIGRFEKEMYEHIWRYRRLTFSGCLHDGCPDCHGTGRKEDGSICIHYLSCPCPKCTLRY